MKERKISDEYAQIVLTDINGLVNTGKGTYIWGKPDGELSFQLNGNSLTVQTASGEHGTQITYSSKEIQLLDETTEYIILVKDNQIFAYKRVLSSTANQ